MDFEIPEFCDAVDQLKRFLQSQGLSGEIVWLTREDVAWRNNHIFIKLTIPAINQNFYARYFELGKKGRLGVRVEALATTSGETYCYVWVPKDPIEAEENGLLMAKFIISLPTELPSARIVRSTLMWMFVRALQEKPTWLSRLDRIPLREENRIM